MPKDQEDKKTWTWCTTAQVISTIPVRLHNIILTPSGTDAECKIYDGENANNPPFLEIFSSAKITVGYPIKEGVKTHRGLYIGAFTNITGVLVIWEPLSEGEE